MSLAAVVATVVLAVLIIFIAMVMLATMRQVDDEVRAAADRRDG
jgi:hypothetical protein